MIVSYSALLIEFIKPILSGTEQSEEYLAKAKIGQIAWNHCVSDENDLPLDAEMKSALKALLSMYPEMKATLDMLVLRKATLFGDYSQFIFKVENRVKANGTVNLYVESAPADKIRRKLT